ncbi:MAG: 50S ribosomal protein L17 [Bdellovibrionota bacterium]
MRHRARTTTFGLQSGPRKALLRGLVTSLVEHGRIKTTVARAKELRRHVEKAITLGKDQTLHAQRLLMSRYPNEDTVSTIMKDLAPRFKTRAGGYTRILKLGNRPGDNAEMAFIEFVDFAPKAKEETSLKEAAKAKKAAARAVVAKKKAFRKKQGADRRVQRG